ncbi:SOS response-associated peptidase [Euryhalocaulis caribicus]|uniref:SOS response-associated peptidase n=1 Tax=Euryhalocaulis caribicus TaxID=1161401 RepID=UPI0003B532BD|nr:SOS response-associated peptidase [Euryhalocaulis caribicus]
MMAAMCGRFDQHRPPSEIIRAFGFKQRRLPNLIENFDVRPTDTAGVIIRRDGDQELSAMRWGIWQPWMKKTKNFATFNARAEEVTKKPLYRPLLDAHRCVVPVDGWYEWTTDGEGGKRRWYFTSPSSDPIALAGLWTTAEDDGERIDTFTILTTKPTAQAMRYHKRMPLILPEGLEGAWTDPLSGPIHILHTPVTAELEIFEVPRNETGAEQIRRLD